MIVEKNLHHIITIRKIHMVGRTIYMIWSSIYYLKTNTVSSTVFLEDQICSFAVNFPQQWLYKQYLLFQKKKKDKLVQQAQVQP